MMYNLGAHKPRRVRELIEARGADLWYLPSYSPDLSPIEEAFSKVKGLLRKAGARTREALLAAIGEALSAITPEDVAADSATAGTARRFKTCENHYQRELGARLSRAGAEELPHYSTLGPRAEASLRSYSRPWRRLTR